MMIRIILDPVDRVVLHYFFVGTRGIDRPVRSGNQGIGRSTGLTAVSALWRYSHPGTPSTNTTITRMTILNTSFKIFLRY